MSQLEMVNSLGISFGGFNYCLNGLIEKGLIKIQNFGQNQSKFGDTYLLIPSGVSEKAVLTGSFLKRTLQEYEAIKAEFIALKLVLETDNGHENDHKSSIT